MFQLQPKTRHLVELFMDAPYGTEFTYAQILQATECDVTDVDRQRIYRVIHILERDHQRTLLNNRGRGYRVAQPGEFADSMMSRRRRAGTQIEKAIHTGNGAPTTQMSDSERQRLTDAEVAITGMQAMIAYQNKQMAREKKRVNRELGRIAKHVGLPAPESPIEGTAEEMKTEG